MNPIETLDKPEPEPHPSREEFSHPLYEAFLKKLAEEDGFDNKLQYTVDFMEAALAQDTVPHFKSFWDARQICLSLFKEEISPALRSHLWARYSDLSKEARRLKEILDEESAFAKEQLEIAIQALEEDINTFDTQLEKVQPVDFNPTSRHLLPKQSFYQEIQRKITLLNTFASRVNALRKELIKTLMRVRQKNKLFQRLSLAGDQIFPLRKDLIKQLSDCFIEDINQFVTRYFGTSEIHESIFVLKDEIKALQSIAKQLTLNTHSFMDTRLKLSEKWDQLKEIDKERKKERSQQKTLYKQNTEEVLKKIAQVEADYQVATIDPVEAKKQFDYILSDMRKIPLGKDEVKQLKDALYEAKKPLLERLQQEEEARLQQEEEKQKRKRELLNQLKTEAETLLKGAPSHDADALQQASLHLTEKVQNAPLTKLEKQEIERLLKPVRDLIADKKEEALLNLSADDKQAIGQLNELLKQRKERRLEVKNQLESYRKAAGSSGLDFEQAMHARSLVETEKLRLERCDLGIIEIEQKLQAFREKS